MGIGWCISGKKKSLLHQPFCMFNATSDQYSCSFIVKPPEFFYIIHLCRKYANLNFYSSSNILSSEQIVVC